LISKLFMNVINKSRRQPANPSELSSIFALELLKQLACSRYEIACRVIRLRILHAPAKACSLGGMISSNGYFEDILISPGVKLSLKERHLYSLFMLSLFLVATDRSRIRVENRVRRVLLKRERRAKTGYILNVARCRTSGIKIQLLPK